MKEVQTYYRTVDELSSHGRFAEFEDLNAYLDFPAEKVRTFEQNPYLKTKETAAQLLGVTEGKIIGAVGVFPLLVSADGKTYEACACPLIHVHPDYRKSLYGIDLSITTVTISSDKMTINCGHSHMSAKMNKLFKTPVFPLRQFVYVKRSRHFFAQRLPRAVRWLVCSLMDVVFWFHRFLVGFVVCFRTFRWKVERVNVQDEKSLCAFCDMVASDAHRFREQMDPDGLRWRLTNDFFPLEMADKRFYHVSVKRKTIGYFMTRRSVKGTRGRILEWQTVKGAESAIPWMLLRAAMLLIRNTDAVVVSVGAEETAIIKVLKKLLVPFTTQYAVVGAHKDSPLRRHEGWNQAVNWRIRPAMGDGCFY